MEANQMNDDEIKGILYFSNGANLIKYDFSTKKKEIIFQQGEKSELGKKITNITYPVYLKSKNRILFLGMTPYPYHNYIFESDLDLKNMKQYRKVNNIDALSLSPDESMIAYNRHPNKLAIKQYDDLENDGSGERTLADNLFSPTLWLSNTELIYGSTDNAVVKVNMQRNEQQILIKNAFCGSVSPNGTHILAFFSSNKTSYSYIYLYELSSSKWRVIIKGSKQQVSSPEIWSPDEKYFIFTKLRGLKFTFNIRKLWNDLVASLEERHDLYIYSLATGEEKKIIEDEVTRGGFWLKE